jgi:NDP-sugar pyrophosphorylase family protein
VSKKAVILAGGLGTRLKPFTQAIPKPLLPIGEQSLLEIQIHHLARGGFEKVFICTNYKADYVETFIGDGSRFDLEVVFSREEMPLGTCGPLSLLRDELTEPFVMVNGDILTTIDFAAFHAFGCAQEADFTIATKQVRTPFNFGSVECDDNKIIHMEEKPDFVTEVVAGIYFMRPAIYRHIRDQQYYGINHLIAAMLSEGETIGRYLMSEYWLDIGQIDDYDQAEAAYHKYFRGSESDASSS